MGVEGNLQAIEVDMILESCPTTIVILSLLVYVCLFSSYLFWTSSSLDVPQPGSHRRKVTQDFSSTVLLRCGP